MNSKIVFYSQRMEIPTAFGADFYAYHEVMYIVYDSPYCILHCTNNGVKKKYPVLSALTTIENNLPSIFFKPNQSVVINCLYLKRRESGLLIMRDGTSFPLSERKKTDFKNRKAILEAIPFRCAACNAYIKGCTGCTEPCNGMVRGCTAMFSLTDNISVCRR